MSCTTDGQQRRGLRGGNEGYRTLSIFNIDLINEFYAYSDPINPRVQGKKFCIRNCRSDGVTQHHLRTEGLSRLSLRTREYTFTNSEMLLR